MKVVEFINKFGWDFCKEFSKKGYEISETYPNDIGIGFIDDLKRLVDSWELVESVGGLTMAKDFYKNFECVHVDMNLIQCRNLGKAIADVESVEFL